MKDDKGLYYYPYPQNKRIHMYVKELEGDIYFRLFNMDDQKLWEEHEWIPHEAINQATEMYNSSNNGFDPGKIYDIKIARTVLGESKNMNDQQ